MCFRKLLPGEEALWTTAAGGSPGQGLGRPPPSARGGLAGWERAWREGGGGHASRTALGSAGQRQPLQSVLVLPGAWGALQGEGSPPAACALLSLSGFILVGLQNRKSASFLERHT